MTDEHNGLTLMCPPDLLQSRCHPSQYLCSGFTVGDSSLELPVDYPPPQDFCGQPPNAGIDRRLCRADPDLDQLGQRHDVDIAALEQSGGGLPSTQRSTAIDPGNRLVGQNAARRRSLAITA